MKKKNKRGKRRIRKEGVVKVMGKRSRRLTVSDVAESNTSFKEYVLHFSDCQIVQRDWKWEDYSGLRNK